MAGIMESSKKRGFADYTIEMFYIDFIEQGQPKKAPFVLRIDDQLAINNDQDVDGPAAHSKLCQPVGICVEFNRNIYVADSGSGSVKMINRPLQGIVDFLSNLQTLLLAFNIHPKGKSEMGSHHTVSLREAIEMVNQTLQYVQSCSAKAKELQSLSEKSVTNGPEGTVSTKCSKSLELLKKSLQSTESNIKELSTYPGFNLQLDLETLLTLHVENQHAVTHFRRDTFSLYEYALIFGSSIEEAVKRISKWAATYYTHPGSYYKLPTTGAVSLPRIHIPKPPASQVTRNEEAQMRAWAEAWEVGEAAKRPTRQHKGQSRHTPTEAI